MSTVLIIGTLVPEEIANICYKNDVRVSAADIAQTYMLHGLEKNANIEVIDIIGAVRVKPYPKTKIRRFNNAVQENEKGTIRGIGYINLPGIAFYMRERAIISCAKDWARNNKNKTNVSVIVYSMHSPFMKAAKAVKKIIPIAKIVVTVADLPLYMDMKCGLRNVLKQVDWYRIKRLMKSVDKYLLYTKYMADYLHLPNEKWMLFEGLFDAERAVDNLQEKVNGKICIYAGNLDARYGIKMLVDAFDKIKSDAVLHIYGDGFDKEYVEYLTQNARNVQYKGMVTSDDMFRIMKGATLLINPRPSTIGLSKYSFPSKTFEYMASGTPVLMTRLPGLPDEYIPYIFFPKTEDADGFAEAIDSIMQIDKLALETFGLHAAQFIKKEKNSKCIMEKVIRFVEG